MVPWRRPDDGVAPFEAYGFSADDYRQWHHSALHGGPAPDAETIERIRRWNGDTFDARQAIQAGKNERRRRFWFGVSTLVGVGAIVLLTVLFTAAWHVRIGHTATFVLVSIALLAGWASIVGRDTHGRK
jgi:hypothetical protein